MSAADLPQTQVLGIYESAEIIMIGKYKNLISAAFQVVALSLKSFNYG